MAKIKSILSADVAKADSVVGTKSVDDTIVLDDQHELDKLGYTPQLKRNRSLSTLLFQSLAIAAIPFGEGGPLITAIYGGGQLSIFLGWLIVIVIDTFVGISIGEIASRFPTSAGPYYWAYQLASSHNALISFVTGWVWLIGNWSITLSVNFGFASLISAVISSYRPDFTVEPWMLLLIFYAVCIAAFFACAFGNRFLPLVDTICAAWTLVTIIVILIALSVKADVGRHDVDFALTNFTTELSGWGGFTFLIGLLPAAYTFSGIGLISSMAEECRDPTVKLPRAIALCVPVGGLAGLFFILPICFTLPPLEDVAGAPAAQALPYIFHHVMGSPGGGLALTSLVLVVVLFCSVSITVAASRTTWAFSRDGAVPLGRLWSRVNHKLGVPVWALGLVTVVQMLLGLLGLGSTSAFTAFVSVGVIGLGVSYAIPIIISLSQGRRQVLQARWNWGKIVGPIANVITILWISFELLLFSMPTMLPVTPVNMNYAIVVFMGILFFSAIWYLIYARKVYTGPPASDGI